MEILIEQVGPAMDEQAEMGLETEDHPQIQQYIVDIYLCLHISVPLEQLGPLARAIGVELRTGRGMNGSSMASCKGTPHSVILMNFFVYAPENADPGDIQYNAHALAKQLIMPFEEADSGEVVSYPYETDKFLLRLMRQDFGEIA